VASLDGIKDRLTLLARYVRLTMKSWFQYRLDAVLRSGAVFLRESAGIIVIYLSLRRFGDINGWNMAELLFLFSFIFLSYGLFILLFTGLRDFEQLIQTGQFDRFLLRPRNLLGQVIVWDADYFAAIGQGGLGLVLFIGSAARVGIDWSIGKTLACACFLAGAVLIQAAIFLLTASASFFFVKTGNLREILYYNARKFAGYPISIFPKLIQAVMIYVVPFAFINYFPSQYFLGRPDMAQYWRGFLYLSPLVGLGLFGLALLAWRHGINNYASTGT